MANTRPLALTVACLALFTASSSQALDADISIDWTGYIDLRASLTKGGESWLNRGLDKSRYSQAGDQNAQLSIAESSLMADIKAGWDWSAFIHVAFQPEINDSLDLIEAVIAYKPAPKGRLSWSARFGHMFPPISRENVGVAWTSPYSITPSAINSWVGEEVKTTGLEASLHYQLDRGHSLSLTASSFMMNDTAGTLLHFRGWALQDIKAGAFSRLPLPRIPSLYGTEVNAAPRFDPAIFWRQAKDTIPVYELDDRPGFYASLDYKNRAGLKAGGGYYNNRGKPEALKSGQYGWATRFWHGYIDYSPTPNWTFIAQGMTGETEMGFAKQGVYPAWSRFKSAFVLVSHTRGKWRLSARFDLFRVKDLSRIAEDDNREKGYSAMLAARYDISDHWSLISEWLFIQHNRPVRRTLDLPTRWQTNQLQASLRLTF